jgi:hypothetical protein
MVDFLLEFLTFEVDRSRPRGRRRPGAISRDHQRQSPVFFVVVALKRLQPLEKRGAFRASDF